MIIRHILFVLFAGTIILMMALRLQGSMLITPSAPLGILSLEFSQNAEHTSMIASEWVGFTRNAFYINMLLDFFFIIFYGLFLYCACRYVALLFPSWKHLAKILANGMIAAMIFDVIENILMIISVTAFVDPVISVLTTVFATLKFSLVLATLFFIIFSGIVYMIRKLRTVARRSE